MEKYNWCYHTEPEPHLGGRRLHTPRGKVLGGSSSINGLVYVRGNPHDFERWEEEGAAGWSYRNVLPYFRRAETRAEGGDEYRGDRGPAADPLRHARQSAACRLARGRRRQVIPPPRHQRLSAGRIRPTGHDGRRRRRSSAANAYLRPAMQRRESRVRDAVPWRRAMLFEGTRAVGVSIARGGTGRRVRARREVICQRRLHQLAASS